MSPVYVFIAWFHLSQLLGISHGLPDNYFISGHINSDKIVHLQFLFMPSKCCGCGLSDQHLGIPVLGPNKAYIMLLLSHWYLKGYISDHQDEKCWSYFENWLLYWHFLAEQIFSSKKNIFSFQSWNCYNSAKNKNIELCFFCEHPIFDSSIKMSQHFSYF